MRKIRNVFPLFPWEKHWFKFSGAYSFPDEDTYMTRVFPFNIKQKINDNA